MRLIALLPLLLLFSSCHLISPSPTAPPAPESATPLTDDAAPQPVALSPEAIERLNRFAFWLDAFLPIHQDDVALTAHGFTLSEGEVAAALARHQGDPATFRRKLDEELMLLRFLEKGHLPDSDLFLHDARVVIRSRLADLVLEALRARQPITSEELQAAYEARRSEFTQPERIRIRMIQVETREEAEEILLRLDEGTIDFRQAAQERSTHESRFEGGELDEFTPGTYNPEFEAVAIALEPGRRALHVSPSGVFIIEKISHAAPSVTPIEQVRPLLLEELEARRRSEIIQSVRTSLGAP